jgi:Transposase DDE domain
MTHSTSLPACVPPPQESQEPLLEMMAQVHFLPAVPHQGKGRHRSLLSLHLATAILWCVWNGWQSQHAVWRLIVGGFAGFGSLKISDQAIYKRIGEQGMDAMKELFEQMSAWLHDLLTPLQDLRLAPFANDIFLLDESVLDQVKRWLPAHRDLPAKDGRLLAGRIAGLFDLRRHLWAQLDLLKDGQANCKVHARAMLSRVKAGDLLLFDLGYYAYPWFDELTAAAIFWISRQRQAGSVKRLFVLLECDGLRDELVWLGAYRADQAGYTVRMVSIFYQGIWRQYLTNVLDPRVLSAADIVRLYARRWDIELAFRLLKEYLGLRLLWSAKWEVVGVQVWASAILAQVLHSWQVRIAWQEQVELDEVSLELLLQQARLWMGQGKSVCELVHAHGRFLGIIRASTRQQIQGPDVPVQAYAWPPPAEVLASRRARCAHKQAGNAQRKKKGEAGGAKTQKRKARQKGVPAEAGPAETQKRKARQGLVFVEAEPAEAKKRKVHQGLVHLVAGKLQGRKEVKQH